MSEPAKKVIVIEDEEMIAKPLTMKLKFSGFEVDNAADGEEGLAKIASNKYDVILLDLMMPKLDGFGVLAELQKQSNRIPVIVATNLNSPEDVSRVMDLGCTNYYVKSDTPLDQIVETVRRAISGVMLTF
jgi:DNA-binding response OmpR family regulator